MPKSVHRKPVSPEHTPQNPEPLPRTTDIRDQRAIHIAGTRRVIWLGAGVARVQSQSSDAFYECEVRADKDLCECADFAKRRASKAGKSCKHCRALRLIISDYTEEQIAAWPPRFEVPPSPRIVNAAERAEVEMYDGARRRQPVVIQYPEGQLKESSRVSAAYREMRDRVPQLLADLCNVLAVEPAEKKWGSQGLPLHERLYAIVFRAFANRSLDDTRHELKLAKYQNYISAAPCKNSLSTYMHDPRLTPLLRDALRRVARLVRKIETLALVDSTGVASCMTQVWLDTGKGNRIVRLQNRWRKAHLVCGGATSVVADVILSNHRLGVDNTNVNEVTADVNFWPELIRSAASVWPELKYALGDKAYLSAVNIAVCDELQIRAMIPIKVRWNPTNKDARGAMYLFNLCTDTPEVFDEIYRYRTKIEGVFSAMKRTTSPFFRSHGVRIPKGRVPTEEQAAYANVAFENELLAKCLVHSLRRIVVLEKLHDEPMSFTRNTSFTPLPKSYMKPGVLDLDKNAEDDEFSFEDDEANIA